MPQMAPLSWLFLFLLFSLLPLLASIIMWWYPSRSISIPTPPSLPKSHIWVWK